MLHFGSTTAVLAAFSISTGLAAGRCQLQQIGVMPVEMQNSRPLVSAKINGIKARFLLDSGAFYSTISRDAAANRATAESFEFLGVPFHGADFLVIDLTGHDAKFLVGDNDFQGGVAGILGAYPLYLRGLAELRNGLKSQGLADITAARQLRPDIDRRYASMGLTP
jgi:hypothetical protein